MFRVFLILFGTWQTVSHTTGYQHPQWLHASLTHLLLPTIDVFRKRKTSILTKVQTHVSPAEIYNPTFLFYFLFVSCRLFLKKKLLALQITIPIVFCFCFFNSLHACIFITPSSFHPSFPVSLTTQSLFYHWCEREEDRQEEEEMKRGRWPAFYLSVFLFVCLIFVQV